MSVEGGRGRVVSSSFFSLSSTSFLFSFIRRLREEHRTTTVLYTIGRQPVKDTDCFPFLPFIRRRRLLADDICVSLQRKQNKTSSLLLLRNAKRCPTKKRSGLFKQRERSRVFVRNQLVRRRPSKSGRNMIELFSSTLSLIYLYIIHGFIKAYTNRSIIGPIIIVVGSLFPRSY